MRDAVNKENYLTLEDAKLINDYINKIKVTSKDKESIAKALAVYSGFTEGLQLFSSFVILLNFPRFGKMKGMGQIITYSIRDESLHVEAMTKLFREFIKAATIYNQHRS